ncbi:MAG: peptidoglycan-binding protein, partial [Pseudomonadota bacterium]
TSELPPAWLADATLLRAPEMAQLPTKTGSAVPDTLVLATSDPTPPPSLNGGARPAQAEQPRELPPAATDLADRGLVIAAPEAAAPVMAQAPAQPDAQRPVTAPSRLASLGDAKDTPHPLGVIAPGAALPKAGMPPRNALAAAPPRAAGPSVDHRPGDPVVPKPPSLVQIIPSRGPSAVNAPVLTASLDHALAEAELDLNRATRRGLQRRLTLIGYDSGGVDGIFGPKTRNAIADFQVAENLQPTGFIGPELKKAIEQRSRTRYNKWRARQRQMAKKAREAPPRPVVATVQVPAARRIPACRRDSLGRIALNQGFSCDLTYLKEDIRALFGGES